MSSEFDYISLLSLVLTYLYRYGGPILMGLGTISFIFCLLVFTKKNLRKSPCSVYMIAINIVNFLLIYTSLLQITLFNGYNINPGSSNLVFCRFIFFTALLLDILSPLYLILASMDRVLVTSPNAGTRQRSTHRLAYICIISSTIFGILFHSHTLVLVNIVELAPNYFICYFQPGIYWVFISYYSLIIKAILIPILMLIFGLWSIKNIRSVRRVRPVPVLSRTRTTVGSYRLNTVHAKDRQLIRIIFIDIIVYIIFNSILTIMIMYQQVTQLNIKSFTQSALELLMINVSIFIYYIPYCIGCYTKFIVSKAFRREMKTVLLWK
jgi:hypothetical protein